MTKSDEYEEAFPEAMDFQSMRKVKSHVSKNQ